MTEQTLGQRIFQLRKQKGITQEAMAEQLGVSPQAVSKWENDIACPDILLLPQLAKLLGVTVDELLAGKKEQPVVLVAEEKRKNAEELVMRIRVLSSDGDKVSLNLPLPLVRVGLQMGMVQLGGNDALKDIDFMKILELAEKGVIGKLVEVESGDGDVVEIYVE